MNENRTQLLDTKSEAQLLDVSPHTLDVWRATNRYPLPFVRIGRNIRYRISDLSAFIEGNISNTRGING